jgi:hypothetical protein
LVGILNNAKLMDGTSYKARGGVWSRGKGQRIDALRLCGCNKMQHLPKGFGGRKGFPSRDSNEPLSLTREFLACLWPFLFPMKARLRSRVVEAYD